VTDTTSVSGEILTFGVALAIVDPVAKFKQCSLIHSRNIEVNLKFQIRPHDPDHAHLGENFFNRGMGL